jgi:hypothetical protein
MGWLNGVCAQAAGEEDDGGEACCKLMTDTLKEWVSPTDEKGFMRTLLCPVLDSPMYKKMRQCSQLRKMVYAVAILGFMVCMESFFAKPWWNQVQGCMGDDCACPPNWKAMIIALYLKALALNVFGMFTSAGLLYGLYCDKPDYVTLWLMWRVAVICLGGFTFLVIFAFSHFSAQSLDAESSNELYRVIANIAMYLVVLAFTEQDAEGEGVDVEGGSADGASRDGDAYFEGDQYINEAETKDALSSAIY